MEYGKLAPIVFGLLAVGCAPTSTSIPAPYSAPSPPPTSKLEAGTPVTLTAKQQAAVRKGVTQAMKDPEAVRFGKMAATRNSKGDVTVCGLVNGKNSFGGYVGMSPFIGILVDENSPEGFALYKIASSSDRDVTATLCRDSGLPEIS
jgi:hypothetical protein